MSPTTTSDRPVPPGGPSFDGAVALVSGAAGGIGAALVDGLLARGAAAVVAPDVDAAGLAALARARSAAGARLANCVLHVRSATQGPYPLRRELAALLDLPLEAVVV
ncbi:MAG: hypothetical protein ACO4BW_04865, partial [Nitriliruptoraceae bacterium]